MDTISLNEWVKYRDILKGLSQKAADEFRDAVFNVNGRWGGVSLSEIPRDELIDFAYALVTKYGEGTAAVACVYYDELAALSGVDVPEAIPAATATYSETAKAINGCLKQSQTGQLLESTVYRLVKQSGADTTLQNAERDGAQFAWIPAGDTCAFCIALASRGWQYVSSKSMREGHAEHIHANCDCQYAVRFNKSTKYQGYDPSKYEEMYYNAPLKEGQKITAKNRVNALRREFYEKNKDEINELKRSAYERSKLLESSAAEELNVN